MRDNRAPTVREALYEALKAVDAAQVSVTLAGHMATNPGWRQEWAGRNGDAWTRGRLEKAAEDLGELQAAVDQALVLVDLLLDEVQP